MRGQEAVKVDAALELVDVNLPHEGSGVVHQAGEVAAEQMNLPHEGSGLVHPIGVHMSKLVNLPHEGSGAAHADGGRPHGRQ